MSRPGASGEGDLTFAPILTDSRANIRLKIYIVRMERLCAYAGSSTGRNPTAKRHELSFLCPTLSIHPNGKVVASFESTLSPSFSALQLSRRVSSVSAHSRALGSMFTRQKVEVSMLQIPLINLHPEPLSRSVSGRSVGDLRYIKGHQDVIRKRTHIDMSKLPTRKIGDTEVTAIGYGAMGIAAYYGPPMPDEDRFKVLDALYERGCTNWDTADIYLDSEELIGKWFKRTGKRDEIFLATKFGFTSPPPRNRTPDGDPVWAREAIERSLKRLGTDHIDLYYLHRPDHTIPIEKSVAAMAEFVKAGKVKYLGLSEVSSATLRRAHAVHPIAVVQVEYSPFTLDIEDPKIGLLKTARELGVKIVAYSPLGRGLLTGQYKGPEEFSADDFRRDIPKFSKENFPKVLKLAADLQKIGERHGATAGQVCLAWILAQGDDFIPIPGTRHIKYLDENLGAVNVKLSPAELEEVRRAAREADVEGDRYPPGIQEGLFRETPAL
ncbi:hypothetical protein EVG20_g8898 [Dentipellis fragilis]|uniref:NADP-dependent oxidoreductase domain-containing protein n=1 Tax=Dentipellis fragilis TaxID=205917 RepID=A0A4Y9Y3K7_9AGAM|nr:hypothetical protein EVG20_g8898 [Dentipellis fragilis]